MYMSLKVENINMYYKLNWTVDIGTNRNKGINIT